MKRPVEAAAGGVGDGHGWDDDEFVASYPLLYHYLTDTKWDDGEPRETATVLLVFDGGWLKAWLNDRALKRSAWVSCDSLAGLLRSIEDGLQKCSLMWRAEKAYGRGRR